MKGCNINSFKLVTASEAFRMNIRNAFYRYSLNLQ